MMLLGICLLLVASAGRSMYSEDGTVDEIECMFFFFTIISPLLAPTPGGWVTEREERGSAGAGDHLHACAPP